MADQDWKHGPLNRSKYVVRKTCKTCGGTGLTSLGVFGESCTDCSGYGSIGNPTARYFVLRIDCGENGANDPHARKALAYYADSVEADNLGFAEDIRQWLKESEVSDG